MVLPFMFAYCNNFSGQLNAELKKEMQSLKNQCPQDQGSGVIITDVNFYENEKILEYISSIEGVEYIDEDGVKSMKAAIVGSFSVDVSSFEKFSIKTVLKNGYRFRYIYTDVEGNKLCEIDITKDDLL